MPTGKYHWLMHGITCDYNETADGGILGFNHGYCDGGGNYYTSTGAIIT